MNGNHGEKDFVLFSSGMDVEIEEENWCIRLFFTLIRFNWKNDE